MYYKFMLIDKELKNYRWIFALVMVCFVSSGRAQYLPADQVATPETVMLYRNLFTLSEKGVMYGHQEDLAYGVGWAYVDKRSDVNDVAGSYPAVYGWDAGRIESDSLRNLDGVPFDKMIAYIQWVYERGGVNTLSWHMNDPVTQQTSWSSPAVSVQSILTNPKHQQAYKYYLDKLAAYISLLKGRNGEMIPIIFRPLHESTGDWFWWGTKGATPQEYISMWRLTFDYLTKEKNVHNLLFAYSASDFTSQENYNERYPGDEFVDIVGFDAYCEKESDSFSAYLSNRLQLLNNFALIHGKLPALTEFGYNGIPDPYWWTQEILPAFRLTRVSYALTWRNWKEDHFFSPYNGQISAPNFRVFYKDPLTLFQEDMKKYIYRKPIR